MTHAAADATREQEQTYKGWTVFKEPVMRKSNGSEHQIWHGFYKGRSHHDVARKEIIEWSKRDVMDEIDRIEKNAPQRKDAAADAQAYVHENPIYVDAQAYEADSRFAQQDADKYWRLSQKHKEKANNPNLRGAGSQLVTAHKEISRLYEEASRLMESAGKAYKEGDLDDGAKLAVKAGRLVNEAERKEDKLGRNDNDCGKSPRADAVKHLRDHDEDPVYCANGVYIAPRSDSGDDYYQPGYSEPDFKSEKAREEAQNCDRWQSELGMAIHKGQNTLDKNVIEKMKQKNAAYKEAGAAFYEAARLIEKGDRSGAAKAMKRGLHAKKQAKTIDIGSFKPKSGSLR
jgi:hypothetical protein